MYFSCVPYVPHPENDELLHAALGIYRRFNQYSDALLVAIQLNDMVLIREVYDSCPDPYVVHTQQLFFTLCVLCIYRIKVKARSPMT